jgi:integrase
MGVFERRRRSGTVYYVSFVWNGRQVQERAGTDKRQALQLERQRKREVRDGTYRPDNKSGSTTLANYMDGWLQARRGRGVRTAADDETRLRMLIVPHLGSKRLDGITRRDVLDVIERLRSDGRLAPKTIRNVYGTLRTLFRDALLEELVTIDPCVLPRGALPSPREMSPSATRRKPSVFSREEIRLLLTDQQVPADRRMLYALLFLTGMRHGEAVGRRWRDLDESALPLGALSVATQYRDEPLKTKTPRVVPVHPVLAELLTAWKCSGFKQFFLREPRPEDFIVPSRTWKCRMSGTSHKGLQDDCKAIGIPGRRVHDTRHTFISLARRDGARKMCSSESRTTRRAISWTDTRRSIGRHCARRLPAFVCSSIQYLSRSPYLLAGPRLDSCRSHCQRQ